MACAFPRPLGAYPLGRAGCILLKPALEQKSSLINKQINRLIKHTSQHIARPLSGCLLLIYKYGGLVSAVCMAVEGGLGSWSRQIGFNVCVRLNGGCATKPSCMYRLISALWLRCSRILFVFVDQLHPATRHKSGVSSGTKSCFVLHIN